MAERQRYDPLRDEIVGIELPLSEDGVPIPGSFKFTSLEDARNYLKISKLSTYVKLITIRSIGPNSSVYHLVIYGTNGSDKAVDVHARWAYIYREFLKLGVVVVGK